MSFSKHILSKWIHFNSTRWKCYTRIYNDLCILRRTKPSTLTSYRKFGFQTKRRLPLLSSKYFNQCLLNYTQKHNLLTQLCKSLILAIINVAMRKVSSNQLTAGILSRNFNKSKSLLPVIKHLLLEIVLWEHQPIGRSFRLMCWLWWNRCVNIFHDTFICWFKIEWASFHDK